MEKHITILGALYIGFSAQGILAAVIVFVAVAGAGALSGDVEAMDITAGVASAIAYFLVLISAPGIIGGVGLIKHEPWARILVLVLGFLNLIHIPLGTLLGIYTIWVLMNDEAAQLFSPGTA